ncbi:hypothetical protein J6J34_07625 [Pseudidiomarina sp. 1ASP75-14]|uniref:hypothetical protein n=1 Tax=Pseudidiomarina terrestris TaxID=2820060 RepID=UPI00265204C4|nr:hypothetical protein [Pseudidiomarina sp. 1ASP75-14]MDN7138076.1 hypothetical protein [Pseudidiomarina sp. 1ASP75-14]
MKLEQFVEESLKQIITGVLKAKEYGEKNGAYVNPVNAAFNSNSENVIYCTETGIPLQQVAFDVAVTVTSSQSEFSDSQAEIGDITVSGSTSESNSSNSSASRIKFLVPVRLPTSGKQDSDHW